MRITWGSIDPYGSKGIPEEWGETDLLPGIFDGTIHIHPHYDETELEFDMALLQLLDDIPLPRHFDEIGKVNRICLPTHLPVNPYHPGTGVHIAGFGDKGVEDQSDSNFLLTKSAQSVDSPQVCGLEGVQFDPVFEFCYHNTGDDASHVCIGDSGAPVVYYEGMLRQPPGIGRGRAYVVGVNSHGRGGCGNTTRLATGWRKQGFGMKTMKSLEWIIGTINTNDLV